jgi:hypothetical protein
MEAMKQHGVNEEARSRENLAELEKKCRTAHTETACKLYPKGLLEEMETRLAEYRKTR